MELVIPPDRSCGPVVTNFKHTWTPVVFALKEHGGNRGEWDGRKDARALSSTRGRLGTSQPQDDKHGETGDYTRET